MALDRVKKYGMEKRIMEFSKTSATVLEVAEVLKVSGEKYC